MANQTELYGKARHVDRVDGYESPDEYADQGDTRMVRDLAFVFATQYSDTAGLSVLEPVAVPRNTVVGVDEIGLIALEKGERLHSFYTSDERERVEAGGSPDQPLAMIGSDPSDLGEYELAEYISGDNPSGKALKAQEVVDLAGEDKDFAHRLLQAENIASDGEPRVSVEKGLTAIIEG